MGKYVLSPEAQKSLKSIKKYSLEHFGKQQTTIYLKNLQNTLQNLADNPALGIERPDIKRGYHSKFIASHAIYYRIYDNHIGIIDILHQTMDVQLHLN